MNKEQGQIKSPEVRTIAFFDQNPARIADSLVRGDGMVIEQEGTGRKVRVFEAEPFAKNRVGGKWAVMDLMRPGDVWSPPQRQILQTLIVAKDRRGIGACVRLTKAEFYNPEKETFEAELKTADKTFGPREGDIAKYFDLEKFERSRLRFQNDSNTLYLVPDGEIVERESQRRSR